MTSHIGLGIDFRLAEHDQAMVAELAQARRDGNWVEALVLPKTMEDALEIQLAVLEEMLKRGERLAGWKVGMTSGPSRDAMGAGFRPFGYILQSRSLHSGA